MAWPLIFAILKVRPPRRRPPFPFEPRSPTKGFSSSSIRCRISSIIQRLLESAKPVLVQMRGWRVQRLQIFTILCMSEALCEAAISFNTAPPSPSSRSAVRLISAFARSAARF
jgi:hypothetical protein